MLRKLLYIDTETSGLDPNKHGPIQIAGIIEIDGEEKERFVIYSNLHPGLEITDEALEINGFTREQISSFPSPNTAYQKIIGIFNKYVPKYNSDSEEKLLIVGQNTKFDYDMMDKFFRRCGNNYWYTYVDWRGIDLINAVSLLRLAGRYDGKNLKLGTICHCLGVKPKKEHDAESDVECVKICLDKIVSLIRNSEEKITPLPDQN